MNTNTEILLFGGAGLAAVGAYLYFKNKSSSSSQTATLQAELASAQQQLAALQSTPTSSTSTSTSAQIASLSASIQSLEEQLAAKTGGSYVPSGTSTTPTSTYQNIVGTGYATVNSHIVPTIVLNGTTYLAGPIMQSIGFTINSNAPSSTYAGNPFYPWTAFSPSLASNQHLTNGHWVFQTS